MIWILNLINKDYLNKPPNKAIFIIIFSKLRKGKKINKKYIIAVHDKLETMVTHTTYQGLAGRMCGFNANQNSLIYCDIEKLEDHKIWIENDYSINNIPKNSNYLNKNTGELKKNCFLKKQNIKD